MREPIARFIFTQLSYILFCFVGRCGRVKEVLLLWFTSLDHRHHYFQAFCCQSLRPLCVTSHFLALSLGTSSLSLSSYPSHPFSLYHIFHSLPATPHFTHCQLLLLSLTANYYSFHSLSATPPVTHCQLLLLSLTVSYSSFHSLPTTTPFHSLPSTPPFTHFQLLLSLTAR